MRVNAEHEPAQSAHAAPPRGGARIMSNDCKVSGALLSAHGNDARPLAAAIGFRPHIWLMVAFWVMTPFFFLLAFGLTVLDPAVQMNCTRRDGQTRCDVMTEALVHPSIDRLSGADLRGARVALGPEPHDGSFKQVELRRETSLRLLATYTRKTHREAVRNVNGFLHDTSPGQISAFIVDSRRPLPARIQRRALHEIAGVEAVPRIPDGLAPIVASLPWRNVYRANALAIRTTSGEEVRLTEWSRRSRKLHERLAVTLRGWLADQGASSNRSS
jgi:hypothetical protein